jgi:superfamily II DNA or RNA helicase/HKD family nuclease
MSKINQLEYGWYESLVTQTLKDQYPAELNPDYIFQEGLDRESLAPLLIQHISKLLSISLDGLESEAQIDLIKSTLNGIAAKSKTDLQFSGQAPELIQKTEKEKEVQVLRGLLNPALFALNKKETKNKLPRSGLSSSELFTGKDRGLSLDDEIKREIGTSSNIDILVSFIRWSGLRLLRESLKRAAQNGAKIRILTTVYLGATEAKCLEFLCKEVPDAQVKISFNTTHGRLHAKGWIFGRNSQFGTAYVGSSNLSKDALQDGLEWNLKITQSQNELVYKRIQTAFEALWNDQEFEVFDWNRDKERLAEALENAKFNKDSFKLSDLPFDLQDQIHRHLNAKKKPFLNIIGPTLSPRPFQSEILENIQAERELHGRFKNLIVMPTGSGKTMLAAFDFKRQFDNSNHSLRLLFMAHRKEILQQAQQSFARVLRDPNFGQLWGDGQQPDNWNHVFATIQTLNSDKAKLAERWPEGTHFDYIIIDEAHHSSAQSYQEIIQFFNPKFLLGLTATPERMDGQSIVKDFDHHFASELRLTDGIEQEFLCPFQYFGVAQDMPDLSGVKWTRGHYDSIELEGYYEKKAYKEAVLTSLSQIVSNANEVSCIGFCCSIPHSNSMAEFFSSQGFKAASITSANNNERDRLINDFRLGRLQYVFTVDLFNEGLDIPHVDTVLFLRPTESLTVFLQQLGRGLRTYPGKPHLTVLDFVSQAHKDYDFAHKFDAMLGSGRKHIIDEIQNGFPSLPPGCSIQLERQAEDLIIKHIRNQIPSNHKRMIENVEKSKCNSIEEFLMHSIIEPEYLLHHGGLWYQIQDEISGKKFDEKKEMRLKEFVRTIVLQSTSVSQLTTWINDVKSKKWNDWIAQEIVGRDSDSPWKSKNEVWEWIYDRDDRFKELLYWLNKQKSELKIIEQKLPNEYAKWTSLKVSGSYTQKGIHYNLNIATFGKADVTQSGVERIKKPNSEDTLAWCLYVNTKKSEKEFSRSTMYRDWALTEKLFHWESPNSWLKHKGEGKRFIDEISSEIPVFLFVRESKKDDWGRLRPYTFLGPATLEHNSLEGQQPIAMRFELKYKMPTSYFRKICAEAVA